ncbi:MAG: uroporphyrinogen decarboxylase family protein [Kiritimatiellia bacterium]
MTTPPTSDRPGGRRRTLDFLAGKPVDRPPFHPIIMRWAARHAGVKYREFCTQPALKAYAMVKCAEDFDLDWVTVMSDPYAEASAFGLRIEYPEDDLPRDLNRFDSVEALASLQPFNPHAPASRPAGRIAEIREFRRMAGDRYFVLGWVEGPVAEYADLRGTTEASYDFMDDPDAVGRVMDVIVEAARRFITAQVEAGADCVGIGDAFCSQIGPRLYEELAFPREKALVDHIHALGAIAKLHICGNTSSILPGMIATGADIIDVDHLVPSLAPFTSLLAPHQVFSGRVDPVSVIQDGTLEMIERCVRQDFADAGGRCILSAGCEITPGTSDEHMRFYRELAGRLG